MDKGWGYCPRCGSRRGSDPFDAFGRDLFSQIFSQMRNSMGDMQRLQNDMFERDIEALDLSPFFKGAREDKRQLRPVQKKGFTIHIKTGTGMRPHVDIKTYGDVNKARIEREVYDKFGVQRDDADAGKAPAPVKQQAGPVPGERAVKEEKERGKRFGLPSLTRRSGPKCTEEPKADVKRIGDRVVVDVCMPGVKSGQDVEIRELESSVEVKAIAGDKAYFKILTKPASFRLAQKSFKDGMLHLEFS